MPKFLKDHCYTEAFLGVNPDHDENVHLRTAFHYTPNVVDGELVNPVYAEVMVTAGDSVVMIDVSADLDDDSQVELAKRKLDNAIRLLQDLRNRFYEVRALHGANLGAFRTGRDAV